MKKHFKILSLFLLLGLSLLLNACTKPVKLASPVITLNETVVSWEAVENASSYKITINNDSFETDNTSYDLKAMIKTSYEVTVVALGDGKKFTDSDASNKITITPENKVTIEKGTVANGKQNYLVKVQSNAEVLGFTFTITYPADKLTITEDKVTWANLLPEGWISDVNVSNGTVKIAATGLEPLNVRLLQSILTLEFVGADTSAVVSITGVIDND